MNSKKEFNFLDGPPFINGNMHHGHALVSSIKDTILRFKEREGYKIDFNFGFDEHGLPLEQAVEKELGEKLDVTDYDNLCLFCDRARMIIERYTDKWIESFNKMNRKIEIDKQYHTSDINYMDQLWSNFHELYQKGLIYQSFKVMPYSPKLGCSLSNFEANSNYATINDNTVTVKFPVIDKQSKTIVDNTYMLAWTTTPWSLIGNMGLGVNPVLKYHKIEFEQNYYYIADGLVENYFSENFNIVETLDGKELSDKFNYKNIFNHISSDYTIYRADYITNVSGTGIVHLAPMFGDDDFKTMKIKDLPNFLDKHLCFKSDISELNMSSGTFLLDTEINIIKYLAHNGFLFSKKKITHQYPMCWRTDTKLVYYANSAWFLNVSKIKEQLISNVQSISWHPKEVAEKRFNNWIKNSVDWCLSRNRIWGTPIPILENINNSEEIIVLKDKNHLEKLTGRIINDLHLDSVRDLIVDYQGKSWKLMGDVFDCWYESGMACVVQQPTDTFKPFDFITESLDQTRGWFYTLNVLSTALHNMPAFRNVKVSGLILANDGKKMSKRLQNYTDPMILIDKYNPDILRLYLISSPASKGESFNFNDDDLLNLYKKFTPIESAINMFNTYSVKVDTNHQIENYSSLDSYIIQNTYKFQMNINKKLSRYDTSNLDQDVCNMIDCICNIYIRLSRDRMNYNMGSNEYNNCFKVLNWVLDTFISTVYPFIPSYYEKWKTFKNQFIYKNDLSLTIETVDFLKVYQLIENGRKFRYNFRMRITLPMKKLTIYLKESDINEISGCVDYIMNELNIEKIKLKNIDELPGNFKPYTGKVGKIFKRDTKKICNMITKATSVEYLEENGITPDLYYKEINIPDYGPIKYMNCGSVVMAGDITIDEDNCTKENLTLLKKKINSIKKEMGLNWFDNASLKLKKDSILESYQDYLKKLYLKYQWETDDNVEYFNYNDWKFIISTDA